MQIAVLTPFFASSVEAPRCGVKITLGALINGLFFSIGSFENTSIAAPAILFFFRASAKSCSFMIPPRATLMILTLDFIKLKLSLLIKSLVLSFNGTCVLMKSELEKSSSSDTKSTFSRSMRALLA